LIEVVGSVPAEDGKNTSDVYRAVLACGALRESVPPSENPVAGTDLGCDTSAKKEEVSHLAGAQDAPGANEPDQDGTLSEKTEVCPTLKPSVEAGSAKMGQPEQYPRARDEERTNDELNASRDQAWGMWDV
jgi:hypothetical protein